MELHRAPSGTPSESGVLSRREGGESEVPRPEANTPGWRASGGVQFHPESYRTEAGLALLQNFLRL